MKRGKRYKKNSELVDKNHTYSLSEAVDIVKKTASAKFDESIDMVFVLGINLKKAGQSIRGTCILPHGTGKTKKVAVIANPEKQSEAKEAGADIVGGQEAVQQIAKDNVSFDVLLATPDMMPTLAKFGKILGPRGLMPSPKTGTVTMDIANAVKEAKRGKVEFRADKLGNIQIGVGRASFTKEALEENIRTVVDAVNRSKPPGVKGNFIKKASMASTMGPGIWVAF